MQQALIRRSVETEDFPLYETLMKTQPVRPTYYLCLEMHSRALVDHLLLTEEYLRVTPHSEPRQISEFTYHEFITMSAEFLLTVSNASLVRYVNWMIKLNRFSDVLQTGLCDILSRLILNASTVEAESVEAVSNLLLAMGMMSPLDTNRVESIVELCSPTTNWRQLLDILGETGALTSSVYHCLSLNTRTRSEVLTYLRESSLFRSPITSTDKVARAAGILLRQPQGTPVLGILTSLDMLNRETNGSLNKYSQVIVSCLVQFGSVNAEKILTSSFMFTDSSDPLIIADMCRQFICCRSDVLFYAFVEKMEDSPHLMIFVKELNTVLSMYANSGCEIGDCLCRTVEPCTMTRLAPVLAKYARHIDLFTPEISNLGFILDVAKVLIDETWRRLSVFRLQGMSSDRSNALLEVIDNVMKYSLSYNDHEAERYELIVKNQELLGDGAITIMIEDRDLKRRYSTVITTYLVAHVPEYVEIIFKLFVKHGSDLRELPPFLPIRFENGKLTVGSRTYIVHYRGRGDLRSPLFYESASESKCFDCAQPILGSLFADPAEKYDSYFCEDCAKKRHALLAACQICLDTPEGVKMQVISCGHVFCSECLAELEKDSTICPTCRAAFTPSGRVAITIPQAVQFFLSEWKP